MHGKTLRDETGALLRLWRADVEKRYRTDADTFVKRFLAGTDYVSAIKTWTPELLDEVRGIADGAGVGYETMLVFQLVDEYWVNGAAVAVNRCSCMGVGKRGDQPACVAQNLDIEDFRDGYQVVLHVKHAGSDLESFVLTCAGMIALNGMNNHGIGICCNTVGQLACSRKGLPVACVVRGVLAQRTLADAVAFLKRVRHASGQNYILGGPDRAYSFECSANKVSEFRPAGREDVVWHTNHPLVNDDYTARYAEFVHRTGAAPPGSSTARLKCLEDRLSKAAAAELGADLFKATLSSRDSAAHPVSVPRGKSGTFTFASTVMVLSDLPELHIAPGPPDVTRYEILRFDRPAR
jgi:predicted choloylglycine hydrolase